MIVTSKQENIIFFKITDPFTIDKSKSWGKDNHQLFPNGGWVKVIDDSNEISHGVQDNGTGLAPVGWIKNPFEPGFNKLSINVDDSKIHQVGSKVLIETLDGKMDYQITEPSVTVNNIDKNNQIIVEDSWIMSLKDLKENYHYDR